MNSYFLESTLSHDTYPFDRLEEFSDQGESLEVKLAGIEQAVIKEGRYLWQRFADFLPFRKIDEKISLGEGNTPLLAGDDALRRFAGIDGLWLKNETQNPTWSFKDRGSLTCIAMAKEMGETVTATISTGNMGHSMDAYGARAGIPVLVFVPEFTAEEKLLAMSFHGAQFIKVTAPV